MKLAIIGYVPPPKLPAAEVFLKNVREHHKHTHELLLYSDHKWPDVIPLKANPEAFRDMTGRDGRPNPFSMNNALFFTALKIAIAHKVTHLIYLESDCRVGVDHWDELIFEQYFQSGKPSIIGGTTAVYNPCSHSLKAAKRWEALVARNTRRNVPIATYGWKGAADNSGSCVFVNGALGVYDVAWMQKLFDLSDIATLCSQSTAWDMAVGLELWKIFGPDVYDVVTHLDCIFSSYGDVLTTESQRLEMVRNGTVCAIHQCKSSNTV